MFADSAVIINEFGAISFGHLLVATPRENMYVLESGCVCCTVQGELIQTLGELVTQRGIHLCSRLRAGVHRNDGSCGSHPHHGDARGSP